MTTEQLDRFRRQLRALLDRVQKTAAGLEEQVRSPVGGEAGGNLSNAPLHLGDIGSEVYAQELGATLLQNELHIRDETLRALERIDRGTYGVCANCHRPILIERLDILPYTRYCTPCAAKLQDGVAVNLNDGRPDEWLGKSGHEALSATGSPDRVVGRNLAGPDDVHAAGTPGGGTAVGGLAGTNIGGGAPDTARLEAALATGTEAPDETAEEDQPEAVSGPAGGAVGGTPANKRARGSRAKKQPPKSNKTGAKSSRKRRKG
jgi:RNA polymerase-binding transcription factor DksA